MTDYTMNYALDRATSGIISTGGYAAQVFTTSHVVTDTRIDKVRVYYRSFGAAVVKVGFYWGNGPTAVLHSETVKTVANMTASDWFEHKLPTPITRAQLKGKAFEIRITKVSGSAQVNSFHNTQGYTLAGSRMVRATSETGAQTTVANANMHFELLEAPPVYTGNTTVDAYRQQSNSGTTVTNFMEMTFTAPWAFNNLEVAISSSRAAAFSIYDATGALIWGSGSIDYPTPTDQTAPVTWYPIRFPNTLPAGTYSYKIEFTSGSTRVHYLTTPTATSETRGRLFTGNVWYDSPLAYGYRLSQDPDYVVSGPVPQRWNGSAWVPAVIKKWNGNEWANTTLTRY